MWGLYLTAFASPFLFVGAIALVFEKMATEKQYRVPWKDPS